MTNVLKNQSKIEKLNTTRHLCSISKAEVEQSLTSLLQQSLGQTFGNQFILASYAQSDNLFVNNTYFK